MCPKDDDVKSTGIALSTNVVKVGNTYSYSNGLITFAMTDGNLSSIQFTSPNTNYTKYNGTYTAPAPTIGTIGDIIHTLYSFPTSYATSNWKNSNDVRVYDESGYMLCFEKSSGTGYIGLYALMEATATGEGDIWTAKDLSDNIITFTLENGVLKSITLPELFGQYPTFSGIYTVSD